MTNRINTLSRFLLSLIFCIAALSSIGKTYGDEKVDSELLRKIQIIQVPSEQLNFKFSGLRIFWITSESELNSFLKNSRNEDLKLKLPVQWSSESVLAIFWESKDGVVRIPSFVGAEVNDVDGSRQMRLTFNLGSPCFGMITDSSPAQLLVVDRSLNDIDRILIHTDKIRAVNCQ